MAEKGKICERQQELIHEATQHLAQLTELIQAQSNAVAQGNEQVWLGVDRELERVTGEKERCLGALKEHRRVHGC